MNPFNQSRYRNEHTLGDSYKIVKDVHDNMDIIKMVADNISNFRSGNIELKGEGSQILWKYTEGTAWFLLADVEDMISPLLQNISNQMNVLQGTVTAQGLAITALTDRVTTLESI